MLAIVGVIVSPLVICFVAWLAYCAWTQHRLPPNDAQNVIETAGKWFPLRLRPGSGSDKPGSEERDQAA